MLRGLLLLVVIAVAGFGCAASHSAARDDAPVRGPCGLRAAMDPRQPAALREKPPACALPTSEEVASSCASWDFVTSPDYRPPVYDEHGLAISGQSLPDYEVSKLNCRFKSRKRNHAVCHFTLSLPQGTITETEVSFEHRFVQDLGPAHHFYGTQWLPLGRCAP
jgi:hypothetical protein